MALSIEYTRAHRFAVVVLLILDRCALLRVLKTREDLSLCTDAILNFPFLQIIVLFAESCVVYVSSKKYLNIPNFLHTGNIPFEYVSSSTFCSSLNNLKIELVSSVN